MADGRKGDEGRDGPLDPDPEIWAELEQGSRLLEVLQDFYTQVYDDERLSHFFAGTTKQYVIDKQFSFLQSKLTGRDVYFGNRPRNAHHWMVISDELFDYREELMAGCLREHGLSECVVDRIRAIDEVFRKQIVKLAPRPRRLEGVELPLDGFGSLEMAVATLCDSCQEAIECGETAIYHRRTGATHCASCAAEKQLVPTD